MPRTIFNRHEGDTTPGRTQSPLLRSRYLTTLSGTSPDDHGTSHRVAGYPYLPNDPEQRIAGRNNGSGRNRN